MMGDPLKSEESQLVSEHITSQKCDMSRLSLLLVNVFERDENVRT